MPEKPPIEATPDGVLLRVRVQPKSSSESLRIEPEGGIVVRLTAPPVDGAANKALVAFLAKSLGVPKRAVELRSGQSSRHKTLHIAAISESDLRRAIAAS